MHRGSEKEILRFGREILRILEGVHKKGFVHNDIKPENIMINNSEIWLIDFEFASRYLQDGEHIEQEDVDYFKGNMFFASHNRMCFKTASRRDDLISLLYLLVYYINTGNFIELDPHN